MNFDCYLAARICMLRHHTNPSFTCGSAFGQCQFVRDDCDIEWNATFFERYLSLMLLDWLLLLLLLNRFMLIVGTLSAALLHDNDFRADVGELRVQGSVALAS